MSKNDRLPVSCSDEITAKPSARETAWENDCKRRSSCAPRAVSVHKKDVLRASANDVRDARGLRMKRSAERYHFSKRCLDIALASFALTVLMPVFVLIAFIVWIDDPGPIFFTQIRVGKHARKFRFYKFRSMVKNAPALQSQLIPENEASGPIFKMRHDPRVTRVGRVLRKYSLDELPQLINVLRGDMSLVGPRPHLPSEVDTYTDRQRHRLTVQPGLVCFREIRGRSDLTFERWIELDLHYIACRSLRTDMQILLRLIPAVIGGRGAY